MKMSTKGRYGVRLMLELALHYGQGPVFLKDIAEKQGISEKYLWQLIAPLKAAGLVNSLRGAHGGYILAKPPAQVTLKDIVVILEGSLSAVECVAVPKSCARMQMCITRDIWKEVSEKIAQVLEAITLQQMVDRQHQKEAQCQLYSI
jgi:Rrf2 family protein